MRPFRHWCCGSVYQAVKYRQDPGSAVLPSYRAGAVAAFGALYSKE